MLACVACLRHGHRDSFSAKYPAIDFAKVDVDELNDTTAKAGVRVRGVCYLCIVASAHALTHAQPLIRMSC